MDGARLDIRYNFLVACLSCDGRHVQDGSFQAEWMTGRSDDIFEETGMKMAALLQKKPPENFPRSFTPGHQKSRSKPIVWFTFWAMIAIWNLAPGVSAQPATPTPTQPTWCFAASGGGLDTIIADPNPALVGTAGLPVTNSPWPEPCGGQWMADNADGYTPLNTPTTVVYQRTFIPSPGLVGPPAIGFAADDEVVFVLTNSGNPLGVTIASCFAPPGSDLCQYCQWQAFSAADLVAGAPNTLTVYVINTQTGPVPGGFYGYSGVNYQICGDFLTPTPTPTPAPTLTPPPTPTPTPPGCDDFLVYENIMRPSRGPVSVYVCCSRFPGNFSLAVYNSAGEMVKKLDEIVLSAPYTATYQWDGTNQSREDCASGTYLFYLRESEYIKTARILLLR
jgi:hypothetical protein